MIAKIDGLVDGLANRLYRAGRITARHEKDAFDAIVSGLWMERRQEAEQP